MSPKVPQDSDTCLAHKTLQFGRGLGGTSHLCSTGCQLCGSKPVAWNPQKLARSPVRGGSERRFGSSSSVEGEERDTVSVQGGPHPGRLQGSPEPGHSHAAVTLSLLPSGRSLPGKASLKFGTQAPSKASLLPSLCFGGPVTIGEHRT